MEVKARSKKGWYIDATLEELNTISGLKQDKFNLGDTVEITSNLVLAETVAEKETALNKQIDVLRAVIDSISISAKPIVQG